MKKGTCVHFNGIGKAVCKAGVNYREHVGGPPVGWAMHLPCFAMKVSVSAEMDIRVPCERYQEPTAEQIAEHEREVRAMFDRLGLVMPLVGRIKQDHKGENWRGEKPCPVCKGRLHLSHSAHNGHVWGKCETKGCVSWME